MTPEELLVHSDFIKRLIRSLVGDKHHADDVLQQTWLTALERRNDEDVPVQTLLSRISRNIIRTMYRGEQSRKEREQNFSVTRKLMEPEEIASIEEARHHLIDAVLELKEPYRNVILRRYYDDMTPQEISERFGQSINTVRTQIKRGVEMMRSRMDARQNQQAENWRFVLAPLIGLYLKPDVGAGLATASAAAQGVSLMTTKIKLLLAAATVCGAALLIPPFFIEPEVEKSDIPALVLNEQEEALASTQDTAPKDPDSYQKYGETDDRTLLDPSTVHFSLAVKDKVSGEPVRGFQYKLFMQGADSREILLQNQTVKNETGDYSFSVHLQDMVSVMSDPGDSFTGYSFEEMRCWFEITSSDHLVFKTEKFNMPEKGEQKDISILLDPGSTMEGFIVDSQSGKPVVGATIGCGLLNHGDYVTQLEPDKLYFESVEACVHTISDDQGYFQLKGIDDYCRSLVVDHPDYVQATALFPSNENRTLTITLERGVRIHGRAFDDHLDPAPGLLVYVAGSAISVPRLAITNEQGFFITLPVAPGTVFLSADPYPTASGETLDFYPECRKVKVEDRDLEVNLGPNPEQQVTWEGVLIDGQYRPLPGGCIKLCRYKVDPSPYFYKKRDLCIHCDSNGKLSIPKLEPDTYWIIASHPEIKFDFEPIKKTFTTPGKVVENIVVNAELPVLSGMVVDNASGRPIRLPLDMMINIFVYNAQGIRMGDPCSLDAEGRFRVNQTLPPGCYYLHARFNDSYSRDYCKTVTLRAGETINNLKLEVPAQGIMSVNAITPMGHENKDLMIFVFNESGCLLCDWLLYRKGDHSRVGSYSLPVGSATVKICSEKIGMGEYDINIYPNKTIDISIDPDDFILREHDIIVYGKLTYKNGIPLNNAGIYTLNDFTRITDSNHYAFMGTTNPDGNFYIPGFKPGCWKIKIVTSEGYEYFVPAFALSNNQFNPFPFELSLGDNRVSGKLPDYLKRSPTADPDLSLCLSLSGFPFGGHSFRLNTYPSDGHFAFEGIPDGAYLLTIQAAGYKKYNSLIFRVENGIAYDFDHIELTPETGDDSVQGR
ncbi:MAG: sigma-70 family RNA polymerase sigma factor [Planctomycetota bacterium]